MATRPAIQNFAWLAADRGIRVCVAMLVGGWSARYLGKANFGILSYVTAYISIAAAIAPLGMEGLAVRKIIQSPHSVGKWLGTVMGFRTAAASICSIIALAVMAHLRRGEPLPLTLVLVLGIGLVGQSLESGELLFQARSEMQRLIVPRLGLFLIMSVMKVVLILNGISLFWFAALSALEQVAGGLLTFVMVRNALGTSVPLQLEAALGWKLLQESWPLALAGLSVVIYMKLGQLLLSELLGDAALGVYAAAIRINETASFLPTILASSMLPGLVRSRGQGDDSYSRSLLRYFRINMLAGYTVTILLCIGAPWFIRLVFGSSYSEAAPAMAVHAWALLFVFLGVARGQHLMNEGLTSLSLLFSISGLLVSLICNLLFIPHLGVMGAALATVVSYGVSALLSSFIVPSMRDIGRLQILALLTPWRVSRSRLVAQPSHP